MIPLFFTDPAELHLRPMLQKQVDGSMLLIAEGVSRPLDFNIFNLLLLGIEQNAYVSLQYSFVDDSDARTVVVYGKATLQNAFKKTTSSGEVVDYVMYRVAPTYYKFNHLDLRGENRVHIQKHSLDDGKWYSHKECYYPSKDCQSTSKTPYVD